MGTSLLCTGGKKARQKTKRRDDASDMGEADPSGLGVQPARGGTAWLCTAAPELHASPLHDCTTPSYKIVGKAEKNPLSL